MRRTRVRRRGRTSFLWISVFFILAAVVLTTMQLARYSRIRAAFPQGLVIAGVPVGGLDRAQAAARLFEVYSLPVELHYDEAIIHLNPAVVGFELNIESMLAAADLERRGQQFWQGFWDYLWARQPAPARVPLSSSYSEARLRTYLETEIAPRYDQPSTFARPAVGTLNFIPGAEGIALDSEGAILPIENALESTTNRVVVLPLQRTAPGRLAFPNLEIFFKQTIALSGFEGLVGIYLLDLQTGQEIHFAYQQGKAIPVQPDISFTAASMIKIPIMVTIFQRIGENPDPVTVSYLEQMIELSGNDPADWVMEKELDPNLGPLIVTEEMQKLGLENTFLAGEFYPGAPLLVRYQTPANSREDVNTDPDPYNQTTPSDIGMLLTDIYECAQQGGGTLMAVFAGEITQQECQTMLNMLTRNKIGVLLEAGVPDGTQIAHKHGWVTNGAGVINAIGDAGVVYSPAGSYVLVVFLHHPVQLIWDSASQLIAELSQAAYNYYNQQ